MVFSSFRGGTSVLARLQGGRGPRTDRIRRFAQTGTSRPAHKRQRRWASGGGTELGLGRGALTGKQGTGSGGATAEVDKGHGAVSSFLFCAGRDSRWLKSPMRILCQSLQIRQKSLNFNRLQQRRKSPAARRESGDKRILADLRITNGGFSPMAFDQLDRSVSRSRSDSCPDAWPYTWRHRRGRTGCPRSGLRHANWPGPG